MMKDRQEVYVRQTLARPERRRLRQPHAGAAVRNLTQGRNDSLTEMLFFASYGVFLVISILAFSFFAKQVNGLSHSLVAVVCIGHLLLKEMLMEHHSQRELWGLALCLTCFLIVLQAGQGAEEICFAFQVLYIFCARDIPFDRIARFTIVVAGTICAFIVVCSMLGIVDNVVIWSKQSDRVRECLGFRYALYLPAIFMNLVALWICERREKITLPSVAALLALNQWIYERTASRAAYGITAALLAAAVALKYLPVLTKRLRPLFFLMIGSYPAAAGISLWLTVNYDSSIPWMRWLNGYLSDRLQLGKSSLQTYGVSLFGQDITWVGYGLDMNGHPLAGDYNFVDCLYLQLLQHYGLVFFVLFLGVMVLFLYGCYWCKAYYLLTVLSVVAFHCMLNDLAQYMPFHTFWLAIGPVLLGTEAGRVASAARYVAPLSHRKWRGSLERHPHGTGHKRRA